MSLSMSGAAVAVWWWPLYSPQDWYPLFPNPVLAEGILDRVINRAHHVVMTGKSYRPLLRPDRGQDDSLTKKIMAGGMRKM